MKTLFIILFSLSCIAQDEWIFKDIINTKKKVSVKTKKYAHYKSKSDAYSLDLDGDGVSEYIRFEIIDAAYYMHIFNRRGDKVLSHKFQVYGHGAHVFKIIRKKFTKSNVATLIYFFDGKTGYLEKKASATLYSILGSKHRNGKLKFQKVTSVWLEHSRKEDYIRRLYHVDFEDVNYDGTLDLTVKSGNIQRNYYLSNNSWKKF